MSTPKKTLKDVTLDLSAFSQETQDALVMAVVKRRLPLFQLFELGKKHPQDGEVMANFVRECLDIVSDSGAAGTLAAVAIEKAISMVRRML